MFNIKAKILVVDDDKAVVEMIKQSLQDSNVLIATAFDGKMALNKAKTNKFDLILLDINLPDMDGYQICESLKTHPLTVDIPIIFLTVNRSIENISRGFDAGAVDYLTKPFHPAELKKRIELHIGYKHYQDYLLDNTRKSSQEKHDIALFISTLGHELRNPLNSILGFSEILKGDNISNEDRISYAGHINNSGNNLYKLLNDIIDLSKIEAGKINIEKADVLINKELKDLEQLYSDLLISQGKDIKISLSITNYDDSYKINTDLLRLFQVFKNLIDNAIKYSSAKNIIFGYDSISANKIKFFVHDDGKGVEEEMQQKIFEYFNRGNLAALTDKSGKGLGLAICRNIVNKLGGEIKLISKPDRGAKFYFTLQIKQSEDGNAQIINENELHWPDKNFLIVDDVKVNFMFLAAALNKTKANLIHAKDGYEAIRIAQDNKLDLILMDMVMPGLNGMETTIEIRKFNPIIPIIAQTGADYLESHDEILQSGCNDIVSKPIKPRILLGLISKYIE